MKQVKKPGDVPTGHHFAIITYGKVVVSDGWGGSGDEQVATHFVFEDRKAWENEIRSLKATECKASWLRDRNSCDGFVAFEVAGLAKIETKVSIT